MVIIILFIVGIMFSFLTYWVYSTFKDSNQDFVGCIGHDKKGFFWTIVGIIISIVIAYYCFVTPASFIHNEYPHKNGTMTTVEYSLTGDSVIKNNIKMPKDTYGKVTKMYYGSRLYGKMWKHYTSITVELNDGREMKTKLTNSEGTKVGNGMSITETFYPYYKVDYNFN